MGVDFDDRRRLAERTLGWRAVQETHRILFGRHQPPTRPLRKSNEVVGFLVGVDVMVRERLAQGDLSAHFLNRAEELLWVTDSGIGQQRLVVERRGKARARVRLVDRTTSPGSLPNDLVGAIAIADLHDRVGMSHLIDEPCAHWSAGQRVAVADAMK